jgi:hypothetical protein
MNKEGLPMVGQALFLLTTISVRPEKCSFCSVGRPKKCSFSSNIRPKKCIFAS